ncbi:transferrin-binding protein-like solute binding protein [Limimaricola pyoseonensis]|uniref:Transferrin-binding protein B C-lobe/N-lobe beta-barrel domain-containing protein n=1 Tax=Limimaricola pyoseonensis TaxID=521013 RepID=A0A1G7CMV4_9RHOB|nr:transferrin-binding protein-like solute binding protein [Limimaricola pyoseonensis]SDE40662.1 hypothetical protein SAMN04488567_1566 [Limimaricola pyoseonensis]
MSLTKTALALLLTTSVAGCIGSGSEYGAEYARLADLSTTPAAELPDTGTASYAGYAAVDIMEEDFGDLNGDLTMMVDFAEGDIAGEIGGLSGDVGDVDGQLSLAGQLDANRVAGTVNGRLSRTEGDMLYGVVFDDESRFSGDMRGEDGEAIVGDFEGSVISQEGVVGGRPYEGRSGLKGGFAIERQ